MRWSVSLQTDGDRVMELDEIVELADAVARHEGIASGIGTTGYAAQIVVEATTSDEAIERARRVFTDAAAVAGLPPWPIVSASSVSEEGELEDLP